MRAALLIAAMIWAAPALAQSQDLVLTAGETVTVRLDQGVVTVVRREPAQLSALERKWAQESDNGEHDDAGGPTGKPIQVGPNGAEPVKADPDTLRFTFAPTSGNGTLLSIANGYDRALSYRATMWLKGKSQATDVCIVMPNRSGLEHWPHPIDRMSLSDLRLVPWQEGDPVPCS